MTPPDESPSDGPSSHRARIYTRTGDDGTTGLLFGGRVRKDAPAPTACGDVDEAQAAIGVARAVLDGLHLRGRSEGMGNGQEVEGRSEASSRLKTELLGEHPA